MEGTRSTPAATTTTDTSSSSGTTTVVEYESSIALPVSKVVFDRILAKRGSLDKSCVIYYPNNVRISDNTVQRKVVVTKNNVMKIVLSERLDDTLFLPVTRKHAIEYPEQLPQNVYVTKLMIVRFLLYKSGHSNYSIRICAEKHSSPSAGGTFVFTAEVEYSETSYRTYRRLNMIENEFLKTVVQLYGPEIRQIDFEQIYSDIHPADMVNIPSRVWSRFSEERAYSREDAEAVTFKFDGYKGRLVNVGGGSMLFYDDLHNMRKTHCPWFRFAPKIVFQVEIMKRSSEVRPPPPPQQDEPPNQTAATATTTSAAAAAAFPSMVLVDVIGAYAGGSGRNLDRRNLFMPEPLEVLGLFRRSGLNRLPRPVVVDLGDMGKYRLRAQEPIPKESFDRGATSVEAFDGYIITIANRIFKYKIPTLDVRCVDGCLHLDDTVNAISPERFEDLEENCIYEIAPVKRGEESVFKVLRKRLDRKYTSTVKEYQDFNAEIQFMKNNRPARP